jgi:uncharacterized protein YqgV (UPF0045/DUF77 family)
MSTHSAGTGDPMGLQLSVYPLRQAHLGPAVRAAVGAAAAEGVDVRVGRLSTLVSGDEETVFRALRAAYAAARPHGPVVVVATLSSGLPTEETVAAIQEAL